MPYKSGTWGSDAKERSQRRLEYFHQYNQKKYEYDSEKILAANLEYYKSHEEEIKEKYAEKYRKDKEAIKAKNLNYYYEHREKIKSKFSEYYQKHREELCRKAKLRYKLKK